PYSIVKTQIAEIVFDVRREPNPCSLCAKMRRGALHNEAKRLGCNKLALGHHNNDVVDTFMLNLIYGSRFGTFQPVTYLSRKDITVIRPFIYAQEYEIASYAKEAGLPVMKSPCPADGGTERAEMKKLLSELGHRYHGIRKSIFGAIERAQIDGYHENRRGKRRPERADVDEQDD
ncbi:MAG TPA: ATP-binding protein, partial [Bacillota bacterium]|nr:ATP-binding protein [Bacillota bacterium]